MTLLRVLRGSCGGSVTLIAVFAILRGTQLKCNISWMERGKDCASEDTYDCLSFIELQCELKILSGVTSHGWKEERIVHLRKLTTFVTPQITM
ncbi:hypothetical protein J6590_039407 [Homalodisca vitripennis]|nr:hypothetical protein J6590_039407 [Homalodisca vitripennis]